MAEFMRITMTVEKTVEVPADKHYMSFGHEQIDYYDSNQHELVDKADLIDWNWEVV